MNEDILTLIRGYCFVDDSGGSIPWPIKISVRGFVGRCAYKYQECFCEITSMDTERSPGKTRNGAITEYRLSGYRLMDRRIIWL